MVVYCTDRNWCFPDRRQIHMHGGLLAPDGKYYIVTPDWSAGMNLFVYDPATNSLEDRGILVPDLVGETRRLVLGPDGRIYIADTLNSVIRVVVPE